MINIHSKSSRANLYVYCQVCHLQDSFCGISSNFKGESEFSKSLELRQKSLVHPEETAKAILALPRKQLLLVARAHSEVNLLVENSTAALLNIHRYSPIKVSKFLKTLSC